MGVALEVLRPGQVFYYDVGQTKVDGREFLFKAYEVYPGRVVGTGTKGAAGHLAGKTEALKIVIVGSLLDIG